MNRDFFNIEKQAEAAAEWWASKLPNPKMDNGDNSKGGMLAMALARSAVGSVNEDQLEIFKKDLKEKIIETVKERNYGLTIMCDYGPCKFLADIADKYGISHLNFPIKTTMWIEKDNVAVRYGYGAKVEILISTSNYWKRQVDSLSELTLKYLDENYASYLTIEERSKILSELSIELAEAKENLKKFEEGKNEQ